MEPILGACGADRVSTTAKVGDVVLAATDGFWDNVSDDVAQRVVADKTAVLWASAARQNAFGQLSDQVAQLTDDPEANDDCREVLNALAESLADVAAAVFDDEEAETPFALAARAEGLDYLGGKEDDISIVVGLVVDDATKLTAVDETVQHNFRHAALPGQGP